MPSARPSHGSKQPSENIWPFCGLSGLKFSLYIPRPAEVSVQYKH